MSYSYDRSKTATTPLVSSALHLAWELFQQLLGDSKFPDDERHNTAVTLSIVTSGKRSKSLRTLKRAVIAAEDRIHELLENRSFPRSKRHQSAMVLDLLSQAFDSLD